MNTDPERSLCVGTWFTAQETRALRAAAARAGRSLSAHIHHIITKGKP